MGILDAPVRRPDAGARSLAAKCAIGVNATVGFAGDSTADKPYEYLTMGLAAFIKQFPKMNADYYQWDGTSAYLAQAPILTGITARTVLMRDDFNRVSPDLLGTSPNVGSSAWIDAGNGTGDWQTNGSALVGGADATGGFLVNTVGTGDGEFATRVTLQPLDAPRFYVKWKDSSNHIRVIVETQAGGQVRITLGKNIAGTLTALAQSEYFYNNTAVNTYDVTVRVVGTRVTASLNGQVIGGFLTSSDVTALASANRVGIAGTNRGTASIDFMEWASVTAAASPGTVTIYNGSQSGSILTYQEGLIGTLFPANVVMDTVFINSGHNYSTTTPAAYQTAIDHFIGVLRTVQPTASIVVGSQNPKVPPFATNIAEHTARCASLADYAVRKGYGYIATFEAFAQLASLTNSGPYIQADGIHPTGQNEGGAGLQSTAMLAYLNRVAGVTAPGGAARSVSVSQFIPLTATYKDAVQAAIAQAATLPSGIVDFEGVNYVTEATVSITQSGVTLQNGGIVPTGQFTALQVSKGADGVTVRNMKFSRSTSAGFSDSQAVRSCVAIKAKYFRAFDCDILASNGAGWYLDNGLADGALIQGGTVTAGNRNGASGVHAASGSTGNKNITIRGVQVKGSTMGMMLFDISDSLIEGCRAEGIRKLPTLTLTGWTLVSGNVYRQRYASGTPVTTGPDTDRGDADTNVLFAGGVEIDSTTGTAPTTNQFSSSGGYVYLNLGGTDPNTVTVTSDVVTGYAYAIYTLLAEVSRNKFIGNSAEDIDGFGQYFQLGDNIGGKGNVAIGNTYKDVAKKGKQTKSLVFSGFGVFGGSDTTISDCHIDGAGRVTTLAASASIGATTLSLVNSVPNGTYTVDTESVTVTAVSGSGPYTATLSSATTVAHALNASMFVAATVPGMYFAASQNSFVATAKVMGCTVRNSSADGYYIRSSGIDFVGCESNANVLSGFVVTAQSPSEIIRNITLTGCKAFYNLNSGFSIDALATGSGYASARIIGGSALNNTNRGVVVGAQTLSTNKVRDVLVMGMDIRDNGSPSIPQVLIRNTSLRTSVINNSMSASAGSRTGLQVTADPVDTTITGNTYDLATPENISGTVIRGLTDRGANVNYARAQRARYGSRTVVDGNSIMIGAATSSAWNQGRGGWSAELSRLSGGRIDVVHNAAVASTSIATRIANFNASVASYNPETVILAEGTNDVPSTSLSTFIAGLTTYYNLVRGIGAQLIVGGIYPRDTYATTISTWNAAIIEWAKPLGVIVIPFWELGEITAGAWPSTWTSDGTHPLRDSPAFPALGSMAWQAMSRAFSEPVANTARYIGDGLLTSFFTDLTATITGLATISAISSTTGTLPAGTYQYRVVAANYYGNSPTYNDNSITLASTGGVQLTVTGSGTYQRRRVYRKAPGEANFKYLGQVTVVGTQTFTDDGSVASQYNWVDGDSSRFPTGMTNGATQDLHTLAYGPPIQTDPDIRGNFMRLARQEGSANARGDRFTITGLTAGQSFSVSFKCRGSNTANGGNENVQLRFLDPTATTTVDNVALFGHRLSNEWGLIFGTFVVPAGSDRVLVSFEATATSPYIDIAELRVY